MKSTIQPGQIFGHLTVLEKDTEKSKQTKKAYWICQCDCENKTIKSIRGDHLTRGESKSCGCENKKVFNGKKNKKDITGQVFGRLTVLEEVPERMYNGHIAWKCKCECGNEIIVSGVSLRNGDTKSCGCYASEIHSLVCKTLGTLKKRDLIGQKFGHLLVIEDSGERQNQQVVWLCECDCKNKTRVKVLGGNLTSGHTTSCGCLASSKGEETIKTLLTQNNIPFTCQHIFSDLIDIKHLKFDFFVNNSYIIEFDGVQHFSFKNNNGWNTEENFVTTRKHDLMKNKYCFDNNIPLIRIPYNKEYTLNDLKLETTRFLLTQENEEEYYQLTN